MRARAIKRWDRERKWERYIDLSAATLLTLISTGAGGETRSAPHPFWKDSGQLIP